MSEFMVNIMTRRYILVICFILGLSFLGYGIYAQINEYSSYDRSLIADATVDKIEEAKNPYKNNEYRTHVIFNIKKNIYGGYLKDVDETYAKNDKVSIYFNKDNPNIFVLYDPNNYGYILGGIGICFIGFDLVILIKYFIIKRKEKKLLDTQNSEA